jgi:hypothetical protein
LCFEKKRQLIKNSIPLGYQALIEKFHLSVIPHFCASFASKTASRKRVIKNDAQEIHLYPMSYLVKSAYEQLVFAVKYEGINLGILRALFPCFSKKEFELFIEQNKGKGEVRKIWYLYELLTASLCNLPDMTKGSFVALLDPKKYYTTHPIKAKRHLVLDNLLGTRDFCPMVLRTKKLQSFEKKKLEKIAKPLLRKNGYKMPVAPICQTTEQTQSKAKLLEMERANEKRHKRFISLLKEADRFHELTEKTIIDLHNKAVGPGAIEKTFRKHQNYLAYDDDYLAKKERICRISPKPEDVETLMKGLLECYKRMKKSAVHPVIIATSISFGFSIIHPFGDGNGRVQLFLLYFILLHSSFSAAAHLSVCTLIQFFYLPGFNAAIRNFDQALLSLVKFTLHKDETLTVHGQTLNLYRSIEFSKMAEFLFSYLEEKVREIQPIEQKIYSL